MTWLDQMTKEMLANLPPRTFSPSLVFNFEHVQKAIAIVEEAITRAQEETKTASTEAALNAARDPFHSFVKNPVFAPMGVAMWESEMTFPLILRRSLLIAISSHVEHVLRRWCAWLHVEWHLPQELGRAPSGDSDVRHCMNYLKDVAGLSLGDFEQWAEWADIDGYRVARNCLAHDGGIVERANDRARVEKLPQLQVDESGLLMDRPVIHLLPGACEAAATTAKAFFDRLTEVAQRDARAPVHAGGTK